MALTEEEFGDVSEVTEEAAELGLAVLQYDDEPTEVADGAVDGGLLSDTVQGPPWLCTISRPRCAAATTTRAAARTEAAPSLPFSAGFSRRVLSSRRNSTSLSILAAALTLWCASPVRIPGGCAPATRAVEAARTPLDCLADGRDACPAATRSADNVEPGSSAAGLVVRACSEAQQLVLLLSWLGSGRRNAARLSCALEGAAHNPLTDISTSNRGDG